MTLTQPLMLLGLLGLALPLLAHLLGRERPRQIAFAALRFVQPGDEIVTHRRRLRDGRLLALRLALLALLVAALARPSGEARSQLTVLAAPHDAVLLLDASRSMELRVDGRSLRARGAEVVARLLDNLPSGSRVALLTTDPQGPRVELSADPARARTAARAWADDEQRPRTGAWPLAQQLPAAAALLERHALRGPRARQPAADGRRHPRDPGAGARQPGSRGAGRRR